MSDTALRIAVVAAPFATSGAGYISGLVVPGMISALGLFLLSERANKARASRELESRLVRIESQLRSLRRSKVGKGQRRGR